MATSCVFCGSTAPLTREHVFGQWLGRIGLPMDKALHTAGELNQLGRDMGVRVPFTQMVKSFCGACNNGWMSKLEAEARRTLTSLILDEPAHIDEDDLATVALWAHKTALVSMLVSSQDERNDGHGVPESEYRALFDLQAPLPESRFWIGRADMEGFWGARITPLVVHIGGRPVTDTVQGYAMTVSVGALFIFGVRYTSTELAVDVDTPFGLAPVWPAAGDVTWPAGTTITRDNYMELANARSLVTGHPLLDVRPDVTAVDLAESQLRGDSVELPLMCGTHHALYPAEIVREAQRGNFYHFTVTCECPKSYLIQTHQTGVRCIAADDAEGISAQFHRLPGDERRFSPAFTAKTRAR